MNNITIGIFFGTILHENMGCNALNYSFIQLCESIARRKDWHFRYVLYWDISSDYDMDNLPVELRQYDISFQKVPDSYLRLFAKGVIKDRMSSLKNFLNSIRECDLFVDTCGGDSFSDIYGSYTLRYIKKNHQLAKLFNKPVVLLPQTIGPFNTKEGGKTARKLLKNATKVYTRDAISTQKALPFLESRKLIQTIDMAFHLKYSDNNTKKETNRINIGVSPSALLWNGGYTGNNQFSLISDYRETIKMIIRFLHEHNFSVTLLGHVLYGTASKPREDDYWLCKKLHDEFSYTLMAPYFYTPTEAKSFISSLDGLMSSRMHCCIGAYSAGVPMFTLGYSRKFNGLFGDTLHYKYGTDLRSDDMDTCLSNLKIFLTDLPLIRKEMLTRMIDLHKEKEKFEKSLEETIEECIKI